MVQHGGNTAGISIPVRGKPCCPSLDHFHLVYLIFMMWVPYRWAILQIWSDHGKIGVGFGIFFAWPKIASQEPQHAVSLLGDPVNMVFSMIMTTASPHQGILCCLVALGCGLSVDSWIWWGCVILLRSARCTFADGMPCTIWSPIQLAYWGLLEVLHSLRCLGFAYTQCNHQRRVLSLRWSYQEGHWWTEGKAWALVQIPGVLHWLQALYWMNFLRQPHSGFDQTEMMQSSYVCCLGLQSVRVSAGDVGVELCQRLWRNPGPACLFGSPCPVMSLSHGTGSLAGSRNFFLRGSHADSRWVSCSSPDVLRHCWLWHAPVSCNKGTLEKQGGSSQGRNAVLSWRLPTHWQFSSHRAQFLSVGIYWRWSSILVTTLQSTPSIILLVPCQGRRLYVGYSFAATSLRLHLSL